MNVILLSIILAVPIGIIVVWFFHSLKCLLDIQEDIEKIYEILEEIRNEKHT